MPVWTSPGDGGLSTSGWTIFMRLPKVCGLPKKTNTLPGVSRSQFHLMPLKNTISISPVLSATITLRRLTALKRKVLAPVLSFGQLSISVPAWLRCMNIELPGP